LHFDLFLPYRSSKQLYSSPALSFKGLELIPMETLEFIIYPDGRVQETVTGITGTSCAEVTAAIEAQLGQVMHYQPTAEYFAQASVQQSASTQVSFSQW
jgi:hypothetical protein